MTLINGCTGAGKLCAYDWKFMGNKLVVTFYDMRKFMKNATKNKGAAVIALWKLSMFNTLLIRKREHKNYENELK